MSTFAVVPRPRDLDKASREPLNPRKTWTFARHETFHLRDGWLYKGLRAIQADPMALYAKDAHHQLGVGPNMLRAILYWLRATGVVEAGVSRQVQPALVLSRVGRLIYTHDPYCEDPATLWLIHLGLATNQGLASFWYWAFNHNERRQFSVEDLVADVTSYLQAHGASQVSQASLRKDATCFLRTYVPWRGSGKRMALEDSLDCPLAQLGLVGPAPMPGRYRFIASQRPSLPIELFGYVLCSYREQMADERVVFSLEELQWHPRGPGRLLGLSGDALLELLEALERLMQVTISRTAGISTVTWERDIRSEELLVQYYERTR